LCIIYRSSNAERDNDGEKEIKDAECISRGCSKNSLSFFIKAIHVVLIKSVDHQKIVAKKIGLRTLTD
jgi:hypothetical protein